MELTNGSPDTNWLTAGDIPTVALGFGKQNIRTTPNNSTSSNFTEPGESHFG